jgi:hypothetical protein
LAEQPHLADWQLLGVEPSASLTEVQQAYRRRRQLYDWDSLATYNLLSDEERRNRLERLEQAYQRIVGTHSMEAPIELDTSDGDQPSPSAEPEQVPDANDHPGAHLRHFRLARGLTVQEVSEETKIRALMIECLENEDFSALPADVYVRGFVIHYAQLLEVDDPATLAKLFLAKRP